MAAFLSDADVKRLLADPSVENRQVTIEHVAAGFNDEKLSPAERAIAEDIFRIMAKDAESRVRETLSAHISQSRMLPRDIAQALAKDSLDSVAMPVVQYSEVLTEQDLIDIVRTQSGARQVAVAKRKTVTIAVSDSLVEFGSEEAVVALVSNEGANLDEAVMLKVVDKFGDVEAVQEPLVNRARLPISVSERLVAKISEKLQDYLVSHHELSPDIASDLVLQSRERATLGLLTGDAQDVWELVDHMYANGRLTPSIMLRALCLGDFAFFESALSKRSAVSLEHMRVLLFDKGDQGFRAVYTRAKLPEALFMVFRAALEVNQATMLDRTDLEPSAVAKRTLERVLTRFEELVDDENSDDVDYLLGKLNQLSDSISPINVYAD